MNGDAPSRLFITLERLAVMTFEAAPPAGGRQRYNELHGRHAVVLVLDPVTTYRPKARVHLFGWKRWIAALIPGSAAVWVIGHNVLYSTPEPIPWTVWVFIVVVLLALFVFPLFVATIWWTGSIRAILTLRRFMKRVMKGA